MGSFEMDAARHYIKGLILLNTSLNLKVKESLSYTSNVLNDVDAHKNGLETKH